MIELKNRVILWNEAFTELEQEIKDDDYQIYNTWGKSQVIPVIRNLNILCKAINKLNSDELDEIGQKYREVFENMFGHTLSNGIFVGKNRCHFSAAKLNNANLMWGNHE